MVEKGVIKPESLLNLDDLLQCPVCYEIPSGQIFQCNEGHHVCGRCKMRLDVCPVCRALFFGTRNYAMEELISNFRKLRSIKMGNKVITGSSSSEGTPAIETTSNPEEPENNANEVEEGENNTNSTDEPAQRAPQACKGLFRCLCCKNGKAERLPSARLLNHLRYFHAPDLLEGRSENGEYLQAWQFSTTPGVLVTAVRVADMGIFFLTIEINNRAVYAWLTMAASPWVAHAFNYTITICGNDREAIFSDSVWSVRACQGTLKKRGHCLIVKENDARALIAPAMISGKLLVRRTPPDQLVNTARPRAVLRIASRGNNNQSDSNSENNYDFLQGLHNDVARLSRAVAIIGREATALARFDNSSINNQSPRGEPSDSENESQLVQNERQVDQQLSRAARRRMRQRLRAVLNGSNPIPTLTTAPRVQAQNVNQQSQNGYVRDNLHYSGLLQLRTPPAAPVPPPPVPPPPVPPPSSSSGPPQAHPQPGSSNRNKKKRRHRR